MSGCHAPGRVRVAGALLVRRLYLSRHAERKDGSTCVLTVCLRWAGRLAQKSVSRRELGCGVDVSLGKAHVAAYHLQALVAEQLLHQQGAGPVAQQGHGVGVPEAVRVARVLVAVEQAAVAVPEVLAPVAVARDPPVVVQAAVLVVRVLVAVERAAVVVPEALAPAVVVRDPPVVVQAAALEAVRVDQGLEEEVVVVAAVEVG